jgi:hypothetical protein
MYRIVFSREPSAEELKLAIDYLHSEPMKEYEEAKNKPGASGGGRRGRGGAGEADAGKDAGQTAEGQTAAQGAAGDGAPEDMGMGMMMGVPGFGRRGGGRGAAPIPEYTASPLGRFAKVLLSSSEFVFID